MTVELLGGRFRLVGNRVHQSQALSDWTLDSDQPEPLGIAQGEKLEDEYRGFNRRRRSLPQA